MGSFNTATSNHQKSRDVCEALVCTNLYTTQKQKKKGEALVI